MRNWIGRCGLVVALGGCDGLADEETQGVALATLQGTLSLGRDVQPPGANLRVSVLWHDPILVRARSARAAHVVDNALPMPEQCDNGKLTGWRIETPLLEQSVRVDTAFPSGFSVQLTEPPPAAALYEYEDDTAARGAATASGDLVVYEDRNGNGKLDASTFDVVSPDLVFGSSAGVMPWGVGQRHQYTIVYLTRDVAQEGDGKAGYSLVTDEPNTSGADRIKEERLSNARIDLTLDPTRYAQQMTCSVMCSLNALDLIEGPEEFLKAGNLGTEVDTGAAFGTTIWSRQDGESSMLTLESCSKHDDPDGTIVTYDVELGVVISEGCTETATSQVLTYVTLANTPVDLGCKEYGERDESAFPTSP